VNANYIFPALLVFTMIILGTKFKAETIDFIKNSPKVNDPETILTSLTNDEIENTYQYLQSIKELTDKENLAWYLEYHSEDAVTYATLIDKLPIANEKKYESGWNLFKHKIPMWIFIVVMLGLAVWSYKQNLSLIPLLGLVSCLYMMAELSVWNWLYFGIWLLIGLVIYFSFSYKNSKLNV
jgi:hypothetical protein